MDFAVYGLLYLDDRERTAENVPTTDFQDHMQLYVNNALGLSRSLARRNITFTLLTNRKSTVERVLGANTAALRVEQIDFSTEVPSGIRFFSAHFKLDAYRHFATNENQYAVLCDLDMICINDLPQSFFNNIEHGVPMCYDISDQVIPAYGHDVIIRDLESILDAKSEGRWSGGEFIAGSSKFFSALVNEIDALFQRYLDNIETLHHIGDECPTSAALERIRKSGQYVADAGTLGIVGRFWNSQHVLHPQKPFEYFAQCSLLHLPSDKRFLSQMANRNISDRSQFLQEYRSYRSPSPLHAREAVRRVTERFGR